MKTLLIISLCVLCIIDSLEGQSTPLSGKIYKTWVKPMNSRSAFRGYLQEVNDSFIIVSNEMNLTSNVQDLKIKHFYVSDIDLILTRNRSKLGIGLMIGAISGILLGTLIGFESGDDPPCSPDEWFCVRSSASSKALLGAVTGGIMGASVGGMIGSIKVKIPIKGSKENYVLNRKQLLEYTIK